MFGKERNATFTTGLKVNKLQQFLNMSCYMQLKCSHKDIIFIPVKNKS